MAPVLTPMSGETLRASVVSVAADHGQPRFRSHVPALDGLRAMSVFAVVAYHLDAPWAQGGYLGVDVFFVLSGFLITGLLVDERRAASRIDVAAFWGRRARRLLPAIMVMLAALVVWASWWADPVARSRFRGDGLAGLLYVVNWRFIADDASYFDRFAGANPLTHLWSLAIEEQFYLVWPLVVGGVFALARKRPARALAALCLVGALASAVAMSALYDPDDASRSYFGTDSHSFGLMMGAAAALIPARRRPRKPVAIAGLVGLAIVVAGMISLTDGGSVAYRGGIAVVALASVPLILAASVPGAVRSLFSWRPLVAIGRVSYGLYLWHWPVIVVVDAERAGFGGAGLLLVRLGLILLATVLSFVLIEQPVRLRRWPTRPGWALPLATMAAAALAAGIVVSSPSERVFARPVPVAAVANPASEPDPQPTEADSPQVLVVGDSTAASLLLGLPERARARGIDAIPGAIVPGGAATFCPLDLSTARIGLSPFVAATEPIASECDWTTYWPGLVGEYDPDVVVLMFGVWDAQGRLVGDVWLEPGTDGWHDHMVFQIRCAVATLSAGGARVAIMAVPPSVNLRPSDAAALNRAYYAAALGEADRVDLIDIRADIVAHDEWRWDGTHYTSDGAAAASELLLDRMDPLLDLERAPPGTPPEGCPDRRGVASP